MKRAVGIPASLTVLVGLPFLIASATPEPTKQAEAPPVEAALTVEATAADVKVRIKTVGNQPEPDSSRATTLATGDGLHTATVTALLPAECGGVPLRTVSRSPNDMTTEWCLDIQGLPAHEEVTGTVSGSAPTTQLGLTVQRREPFGEFPLWVLLAGLAAGFLASLFGPFLTSGVGRGRLGLLLATNDRRSVRDRIAGLRDWADARKAEGMDDGTLRAKLAPVVDKGPAKARTARVALANLLSGHPLPASHPLTAAAAAEARRVGHRIDDFLDANGNTVLHPAEVFHYAVEKMEQHKQALASLEREMQELLVPKCWPPEVGATRLAYERLARPDELDALEKQLDGAREALDIKLSEPGCRTTAPRRLAPEAAPSILGLPIPQDLAAAGAAAVAVGWALITLLSILVALAFAGLTVYTAAYDGKPTFGSWQDYFALFSAALASGAAATVLGLLVPWRDPPADADA